MASREKKIIDGKDFEQPNGISSALLPILLFLLASSVEQKVKS